MPRHKEVLIADFTNAAAHEGFLRLTGFWRKDKGRQIQIFVPWEKVDEIVDVIRKHRAKEPETQEKKTFKTISKKLRMAAMGLQDGSSKDAD